LLVKNVNVVFVTLLVVGWQHSSSLSNEDQTSASKRQLSRY